MNRVNITSTDESDGRRRLIGWFDRDAAEEFAEDRAVYDGANLAGVHLRDQNRGQVLYHTSGDRWVLHQWSRWQGVPDEYRFIGVDAAREWLAVNGDDAVIERLFGEPLPPESGPGRPEIGPLVSVRMPQEMVDRLDKIAGDHASRAEVIRSLLWQQLYTERTGRAYTDRTGGDIGTDEEEGIR